MVLPQKMRLLFFCRLTVIFKDKKKPNLRDLAFQMSNSRSPQLESDLFFTLSNQAFK